MQQGTTMEHNGLQTASQLFGDVMPKSQEGIYRWVFEDIQSRDNPWRAINAPGKPRELDGVTPEDVDALMRTKREGDNNPQLEAYGLWLNQVMWTEQNNCTRLETLLWALRTARERRDAVAVDRIESFIGREYNVAEEPPDALSARSFSSKHTRNRKAMSRDWRLVGWGLGDRDFEPKRELQSKREVENEWEDW